MSQLDSGQITLDDYVRYAKFFLCSKTKRLMKDPIWDSYTTEEILAEFFAHQFETNKRFLEDFEVALLDSLGQSDDFSDWADSMMSKDKRILEKTLGGMEDRISFDPTKDVIGADE
jgi:hypothetical protein